MGLLDRMSDRLNGNHLDRLSPVASAAIPLGSTARGYDDSQFSPNEYGDYIATSNEIYSAAMLRARLMSGLDLRLYKGKGNTRLEVEDGPVNHLLDFVNPFWTWERLSRMDELSMCLFGESYWAVEKKAGRPTEIWWLKPSRVKVVPDPKGYIKGYVYEGINGETPLPFKTDEIVWFRHPNPIEEFSALSPVAPARLAADTASAMMKSNSRLFKDGLQLGGVIVPDADKVTFSQEQADELERLLDKRWTSAQRRHRWAVLRFEAKFQPMSMTPKDAEFVAGLSLTLKQIANAYGIPVPLLNEMEGATLANLREFQQVLWTHSLVPDAKLRAAEIREQFLPMFKGGPDYCEFDFTKVAALQESASSTWDRERQAIEVGSLTINEWRKSKGYPPVAWGDSYWVPVNKTPVTDGTPPEIAEPTPAEETGQTNE